MMPKAYVTAGRVAWLRQQLGDRDLAVLDTLARIRVASGRQLERLHFSQLTPLSAARQRQRTLRRLHELGLLARLSRRVGGVQGGSGNFLWSLDVAGQRLLSHHGPAGGSTLRRPWTPSPPFLEHLLLVTELHVRTVELTREIPGLTRITFEAEPACWRQFLGPHGGRVVLKPDAFLVLATGEYEDRYFVEVDRGTESPAALARKAGCYRQYWASGREQARHDVFPRVLWTVPDERRRAVLVEVIGRQPAESWQLYQVVVFEEAMRAFQEGAAS